MKQSKIFNFLKCFINRNKQYKFNVNNYSLSLTDEQIFKSASVRKLRYMNRVHIYFYEFYKVLHNPHIFNLSYKIYIMNKLDQSKFNLFDALSDLNYDSFEFEFFMKQYKFSRFDGFIKDIKLFELLKDKK